MTNAKLPKRTEDLESISRKRLAKVLKLIGSAILLLSFATQNFFYDAWHSQADELRKGVLEQAVIDKSVLLNELLFFVAELPADASKTEAVRRYKIREAARKVASSQSMPVSSISALTTGEKTDAINKLRASAAKVVDYDSFLSFLNFVNSEYGKYSDQFNEQRQQLERKQRTARWIYLVLYVLGSFVLILGIRYE